MFTARKSLKAIAAFEALKGVGALLLATGFVIYEDRLSEQIARHLHHPGFHPTKQIIFTLAALYATIRFAEAYGLYKDRAWGQWLGIISGGLYLPFEIKEIIEKPTLIKAAITIGNLLVVLWLIRTRAKEKGAESDAPH